MYLKDRFKSCITEEEIDKYKDASERTQPIGGKIFEDETIDDVINNGIDRAKENNRRIVSEQTMDL